MLQVSKTQYEVCIGDRNEKMDQLYEQLNILKQEISRLLKELDAFQLEKSTAHVKISNLEKEIRELKQEISKVQLEESEKYKAIKLRLTKEIDDKNVEINELKKVHQQKITNMEIHQLPGKEFYFTNHDFLYLI